MRFNRNKSELHSPSKSRMSDKLLTEIIHRPDGEQILSVTLNQINNTLIYSTKQLGSCSALTTVQFNHNKSNRPTREKKLILTPVILEV